MNDTPSGDSGQTPLPGYEQNGVWIYSGSIPFDQLPFLEPDPDEEADYDWASTDLEVRRQYGGLVVAVHDRKVWGAGKNHQLAWEDASRNPACPEELVYVCVSALPGPDARER